jgi:membrane associated rhomboid family serine protease
MGVSASSDGIAHFAHLGGMIFAAVLLFFWKKKGDLY